MKTYEEIHEYKSLAKRLLILTKRLPEKLLKIMKSYASDSVEYRELEYLIRSLENVENPIEILTDIEQFQKLRVEGFLVKNNNERYQLGEREFTCGSYIEIYIDDSEDEDHGWQFGRVEHSAGMGGYYFYGTTSYKNWRLQPGMQAAYRV